MNPSNKFNIKQQKLKHKSLRQQNKNKKALHFEISPSLSRGTKVWESLHIPISHLIALICHFHSRKAKILKIFKNLWNSIILQLWMRRLILMFQRVTSPIAHSISKEFVDHQPIEKKQHQSAPGSSNKNQSMLQTSTICKSWQNHWNNRTRSWNKFCFLQKKIWCNYPKKWKWDRST